MNTVNILDFKIYMSFAKGFIPSNDTTNNWIVQGKLFSFLWKSQVKNSLQKIISHFSITETFVEAVPYGSGHIHDTYVVHCQKNSIEKKFLLQKINDNIFKDPISLMNNIDQVTCYLHSKAISPAQVLRIIPTKTENLFYKSNKKEFWRLFHFIDDTISVDIPENKEQIYEVAKAFAQFQELLIGFPVKNLYEILPDFHNTPKRFENLQIAVEEDSFDRAKDVKEEIKKALSYKNIVSTLTDLEKNGELPCRVVHNDTKINNVLLDKQTLKGVAVIDLDLVMPGLTLYDFGDLMRTATGNFAENEVNLTKIFVSLDYFEALVKGYLEIGKNFLNTTELDHLVLSGQIITCELAFRFLADYLQGDTYFKTTYPGENIDRTNAQLQLAKNIGEQKSQLEQIIKKYR